MMGCPLNGKLKKLPASPPRGGGFTIRMVLPIKGEMSEVQRGSIRY